MIELKEIVAASLKRFVTLTSFNTSGNALNTDTYYSVLSDTDHELDRHGLYHGSIDYRMNIQTRNIIEHITG